MNKLYVYSWSKHNDIPQNKQICIQLKGEISKLNKSFIQEQVYTMTLIYTMTLHHGTKSHSRYMILETFWWHAFSQRIRDHQFSADVFNNHFLFFNTLSYG